MEAEKNAQEVTEVLDALRDGGIEPAVLTEKCLM